MGNRGNLILKKEMEDEFLFESNNSLPFFWIGLLDKDMLESCRETWKNEDELVQKEEENLEDRTDIPFGTFGFQVYREAFERNGKCTGMYLQEIYPEAYPLYVDFYNYLNSKFTYHSKYEDYLIVDIIQLSGFYKSACEFLDILQDAVNRIENREVSPIFETGDLIAFGTGFSVGGFQSQSTYYRQMESIRKNNYRKDIQSIGNSQFSWKRMLSWVLILLLCPLFSYITYRLYLKESFSLYVILTGLFNIGFYVFSISAVYGEWILLKKYKANKKRL